jgi:hypothetical protein
MKLTDTQRGGFIPFTDGKEHTLKQCDFCNKPITATMTNGACVADDSGITAAYLLNLWLCRQCYERAHIQSGIVETIIDERVNLGNTLIISAY